MQPVYSSIGDIEARVVIPALGDNAPGFDTLAIAHEIAQQVDIPHSMHGWVDANRSGWIVATDGPDFWAVVEKYAL